MKNIIIPFLIALFFLGCTPSSLTLTSKGDLNLEFDSKIYLLSDKVQKQELLNFKDLFINQYKIDDENGVLFYEKAYTDLMYEFKYMELSTVMFVFDDSQKYEKLFVNNNLTLAQIQLKNKKYVNVIIQASTTQEYSFIYGFSNEAFMKIAQNLKSEDSKLEKLKFLGVTFDKNSKPLTNWNDLLVFFEPLIIPNREFTGR